MVLRRIFGLKRDEVIESVRKMHDEELHNLCSLRSISRMMKPRKIRWAGHEVSMQDKRNACKIMVGKPEGKRPPGRPRHK
jgi:hypothetical protein